MTRRTELLALADRVEKGETGRAIDGEIWLVTIWTDTDEGHYRSWTMQNGRTDLTRQMFVDAWTPAFTISIDAQAALPRRIVKVWTTPDGMGAEAESGSVISECVSASTEPAARLAALLRAMAAAEA